MKFKTWIVATLLPLVLGLPFPAAAQQSASMNKAQLTHKVDSVMQKMTLTDKVGEMTQLTIDAVLNEKKPNPTLSPKKLRNILLKNRVGSILNVSGHAYTLKEWHQIIRQIQDIAVNDKPTGIPVLYGIDSIHGANYVMGSTLFPQQIGMAATWNPDLVRKGARISAYETRASWIPWVFSPVLGIGMDPRWPRFWETFGEDVYLTKTMGVATIEGYQDDDMSKPTRVAATAKHFLGYSLPKSGHDRTTAWIPERELREYVLPSFQAAIDAGAQTIMVNSGEINGIPVHANKKILTDLLRNELHFKGLAVTDWQDIHYLYQRYHIAKNYKEAIKLAVNAGIDMSMVPFDTKFPRLLKELVEEREVPMSRINESVRRILRVKFELGLFSNPYNDETQYPKFASNDFTQAAYQAAVESITLLKNKEGILPLSENQKILVTGPTADSLTYLNGGWSRTWQGADPSFNTPDKKTILQAVQNKIGAKHVSFVEGSSIDHPINIQEAVSAAKHTDVAVVCIGESTYTETPGDIRSLDLPNAQQDLVKKIAETGTPVVLIMVEGRPRIVKDIAPLANGILLAYLPGQEGGRAITDILFGDQNPSGELPYTYPRAANDLVSYDHNYTDETGPLGFNPQWKFGHGMSYTSFKYSHLQISDSTFSMSDSLKISVDLTNTGDRVGKEIVQLFVSDIVASINPSVKRVRGFKKVELQTGETKTLSFTLSPDDLAFVGKNNTWTVEPGVFEITLGSLHKRVSLQEE